MPLTCLRLDKNRSSSATGASAVSDAQNKVFNELKRRYPDAFDRVRVHMTFPDGLVKDVNSENSTRGRSFLFIALGALAGTGLGDSFTLRIPENGLIALNVPLDPLRLGSNSTRTTHPFYPRAMRTICSPNWVWPAASKIPIGARRRGKWLLRARTKKHCAPWRRRRSLCAHPSSARWQGVQGKSNEHCGHCLPPASSAVPRLSVLVARVKTTIIHFDFFSFICT